MLAYKDGVRVKRRTMSLTHIENCILMTREEVGFPSVCIITSINDGRHSTNSRHYTDEAVDLRCRNGFRLGGMGSRDNKVKFQHTLAAKLGSRFVVLFEHEGTPNEHFHIQVRRGETYP